MQGTRRRTRAWLYRTAIAVLALTFVGCWDFSLNMDGESYWEGRTAYFFAPQKRVSVDLTGTDPDPCVLYTAVDRAQPEHTDRLRIARFDTGTLTWSYETVPNSQLQCHNVGQPGGWAYSPRVVDFVVGAPDTYHIVETYFKNTWDVEEPWVIHQTDYIHYYAKHDGAWADYYIPQGDVGESAWGIGSIGAQLAAEPGPTAWGDITWLQEEPPGEGGGWYEYTVRYNGLWRYLGASGTVFYMTGPGPDRVWQVRIAHDANYKPVITYIVGGYYNRVVWLATLDASNNWQHDAIVSCGEAYQLLTSNATNLNLQQILFRDANNRTKLIEETAPGVWAAIQDLGWNRRMPYAMVSMPGTGEISVIERMGEVLGEGDDLLWRAQSTWNTPVIVVERPYYHTNYPDLAVDPVSGRLWVACDAEQDLTWYDVLSYDPPFP